jgi:hypothetical protein
MTRRRFGSALAIICLVLLSGPLAQEGHPLVGTWRGTWGPGPADRHNVTLVLQWDGKMITGVIDPGPNAIRFEKVTLEPGRWAVRFEAAPKNESPIVIEATIQDVTNRRRSLVGTWVQGSMKGDLKIFRD